MRNVLRRYAELFRSSKVYFSVFVSAFALGAIAGLFFTTALARAALADNVIEFYMLIFSGKYNLYAFAFTVILSDAVFILIFYGCSFNFYLGIVDILLLFYRGYVLFSVTLLFFKLFGVGGAYAFVFCVFLHNAITSVALAAFASILSYAQKKNKKTVKCLRKELLVALAATVFAAVIIELTIILLLFRPLNAIF